MRTLFLAIILPLLLAPALAQARVRVAFLELHDSRGKLVQLEPGGRFAHVAISQGEKWLHAYPRGGVSYTTMTDLEKIGTVAEILTIEKRPDISTAEAKKYLGKPYDSAFSWDDSSIYCSELVAKLLALEPEPMNFSAGAWKNHPAAAAGRAQPGLSPDDLYRILSPESETDDLMQN